MAAPPAPVDPTIIVAIITSVGVVLAACVAAGVAVYTNRSEKHDAAETSADAASDKAQEQKEEALRERLALRDDQVADRDSKIAALVAQQVADRAEIKRLNALTATERAAHSDEIDRLRARVIELEAEIVTLRGPR